MPLSVRNPTGRFVHGNTAAAGNRGGGRPPSILRELPQKDARRIWRELRAVAFDVEHPLHARHAFEALRTLATLTFPKPQAIAVETARGDLPSDCIVVTRVIGQSATD